MARIPRAVSSTGIYHVMMRGINHRNIYRDHADKLRFLKLMHGLLQKKSSDSGKTAGEYEVYAYALMGNHFHLLIRVVSGKVGDFVKALASSYVLYFNAKYNRDGHLFKERFRSEPCENDDYFYTLLRYIHQNPIKSGAVTDLLKYRFTSWQEYAAPEEAPYLICNLDYVLEKKPMEQLEKEIYEILPDNEKCIDIDKPANKVADVYVTEYLKNQFGVTNPQQIKSLDKQKKYEIIDGLLNYGAGMCQMERLTGLSKATISRRRNKMLMIESETK